MFINILINEQSRHALSYEQVLSAIEEKQLWIVTYCLDFASFHYHLNKGYDIRVFRKDEGTGKYSVISVSELLENKRPYSNEKEIRRAHNIPKMIKGNALLFLPPVGETLYEVEYTLPSTGEKIEEIRNFEPIIEKGKITGSSADAAARYAASKASGGSYSVFNIQNPQG